MIASVLLVNMEVLAGIKLEVTSVSVLLASWTQSVKVSTIIFYWLHGHRESRLVQ